MRSLIVREWGEPTEKLHLEGCNLREPRWNEVRVRMVLSPINPSDLMMIRNRYGRQPALPCVPGFEGVGVVEAGRGPLAWRVMNRRVAVIAREGGAWASHCLIPAIRAIPLSSAIPDEQAASFFVNPVTAWAMIRKVLQVPKGAWIVQTAAAGAVGQMIIRLGKRMGFRTVNVIRTETQLEYLLKLGADKVIVANGEDITDKILHAMNGELAFGGLDPVGGATGAALIPCLGRHGRLLLYGRLSSDPLPIKPGRIMAGMRKIEGFWLSEWTEDQSKFTMWRTLRQVGKAMAEGVLYSPVGKIFPVEQFQTAIHEAETQGKPGKVLLRFSDR